MYGEPRLLCACGDPGVPRFHEPREPLSTFGKLYWSGSLLFRASIKPVPRTSGLSKFLALINIAGLVKTAVSV